MTFLARPARAALVASALHLVALGAPSLARAEGVPAGARAGGDVIYLRSGGSLRGTLIDVIPSDRARLQLVTGEIATVAWAEIVRIERADGSRTDVTPAPAAAPAPRGPAPAAPPAAPPPPPPVQVLVHIDGPEDARLEQDASDSNEWVTVCSAPCDRPLSTAGSYRFTGSGMKTSTPFPLHGQAGSRVTLQVSPASTGWFITGIVFIPVGGLTALVGFFVGLVGSLASTFDSGANGLAVAGWTTAAIGAGAATAGIVLTVTNIKTGVQQDVEAPRSASLRDAWKLVPSPTWREASPEQRALPPAPGVPVFSGSF